MLKFILSVCLVTFLQACDIQAEPEVQNHVEKRILFGYYIYGHEVNSFKPCGQKNVFWVTASEELLKLLERKYWENSSEPYEEVFLEIKGNFIGKALDGFAMDYDGQILVMEMVGMKKKSPSDCNKIKGEK